jgi:hypothetical protein
MIIYLRSADELGQRMPSPPPTSDAAQDCPEPDLE